MHARESGRSGGPGCPLSQVSQELVWRSGGTLAVGGVHVAAPQPEMTMTTEAPEVLPVFWLGLGFSQTWRWAGSQTGSQSPRRGQCGHLGHRQTVWGRDGWAVPSSASLSQAPQRPLRLPGPLTRGWPMPFEPGGLPSASDLSSLPTSPPQGLPLPQPHGLSPGPGSLMTGIPGGLGAGWNESGF